MRQRAKRNAVMATVLLFVAAAVYLNWRYASDLPLSEEGAEVDKVLGQSTLVSGELDGETADGGSAAEVDYFSNARLTRQQARDSALAMLREAAADENADEEASANVAEGIQVLAGYAIAEAQIENLVTAKGYADCVAFMGEESISVVVNAGDDGLQPLDVARISEIVLTETDYTAEQIKVLEAS